ncbi:Mucosa-associated lymphoid tissue lymphoma translocation protein 1 [Toxocara canis]|uniref:Mucosa-associated lymphoid tissue lymphoma translocation protein 1 n=1 Tax=Toxocara canis TaxID=6265 RepID=A0A0B2VL11_TOXCA|nr:Mucosa-associated lymphoid tissue lymphoma translocation protein 1 [Toxocara canis]
MANSLRLSTNLAELPFNLHFQLASSLNGCDTWLKIIDDDARSVYRLRCACSAKNVYKCRVWNEVEDGMDYSEFYRSNGKQFRSEMISDIVDLSAYNSDESGACDRCKQEQMARLQKLIDEGDQYATQSVVKVDLHQEDEQLVAADKVALIISNCNYEHLPDLITPHCDAETFAQSVQELKYKTVTLGDLNLEEMQFIVREYKKLLGNGVYAIFYFVGHGFEANGQCYLLPVDAPAEGYSPEHCLSMDWVLSIWQDHVPALNLILLDVCRKFLPCDMTAFVHYAQQFRTKVHINRNTIYGYATSGGVSAYEVRGENNGVFMKYLKNHLKSPVSVIEMLNRVFRDIDNDKKVCDVQVPELRSNLAHSRSLTDPLIYDGHTVSFEYHTIHWRCMHELPSPVNVEFKEQALRVTVWFDFVGHFTNKVYVFSSVGDIPTEENDEIDEDKPPSDWALSHLAHLKFDQNLETSNEKILTDSDEGVSLCLMLSNLQRANGEIKCCIELRHRDDDSTVVARADALLGHLLITKVFAQA